MGHFLLFILILIAALVYSHILFTKKHEELENLKREFEKERIEIRKDAKKRSGAVQWGKTIEHFTPFTSDFPLPPEDVKFLGMPIDFIGFSKTNSKDECSIHFIEVKSGKSNLLSKQRNIKKAILEKRVHWHEVIVEGNSVK